MNSYYIFVALVLVHVLCGKGQGQPTRVPLVNLGGNTGTCPADLSSVSATSVLSQNISAILANLVAGRNVSCGGPGWRRVASLDMTDSTQSCPTGLALKTYTPGTIRSCGRATDTQGCWSTTYSTGTSQYSRVCGRIRGYQYGHASAFGSHGAIVETIDADYVEGVSLTHGPSGSRTHIWTFAVGLSEVVGSRFANQHCPCGTPEATPPPAFVGNDYFCESGFNSVFPISIPVEFYPNDPLWDGQYCSSLTTCCQFNNPPYFTKTLPAPTSDDIELRVCSHDAAQTDTPIDQVELYVQ